MKSAAIWAFGATLAAGAAYGQKLDPVQWALSSAITSASNSNVNPERSRAHGSAT
jgi:hypothetical protein